jgi:hypothetical protein
MTEFVSRVFELSIRRVLAEPDFVLLAEGFDLRASDAEQRAVDGEFAELRERFHAPESCGACSPQKVEKTGLDLIIGMVCQNEGFCFQPDGTLLEEGHAQFAGGEFEGFFLVCGKLRSSAAGMLDGKPETTSLVQDKAGIRIRTPPAQGVVKMANDEIFKTSRQKRMEQDHGITTARDADEEFFSLRNACHRLSKGRHHGIG